MLIAFASYSVDGQTAANPWESSSGDTLDLADEYSVLVDEIIPVVGIRTPRSACDEAFLGASCSASLRIQAALEGDKRIFGTISCAVQVDMMPMCY